LLAVYKEYSVNNYEKDSFCFLIDKNKCKDNDLTQQIRKKITTYMIRNYILKYLIFIYIKIDTCTKWHF